MQKHFAAIDCGFGYCKFTTLARESRCVNGKQRNLPVVKRMRSLAPRGVDLGIRRGLNSSNVVTVQVPDNTGQKLVTHVVGPDAINFDPGDSADSTTYDFYTSTAYRAQHLGALAYMGFPRDTVIGALVVGLPPAPDRLFGDPRLIAEVKAFLQRTHKVPVPNSSDFINVTVERAIVVPQGLGAYIHLREHYPPYGGGGRRCLTLDSGFGTFIGYVSRGDQPILGQSTHRMAGAGSLIRELACELATTDIAETLTFRTHLDEALRNRKASFESAGATYQLTPQFEESKRYLTKRFLQALLAGRGNLAEFECVGLSGGSLHLYEDAVRDLFRPEQLTVQRDEQGYAQVLGYYLYAVLLDNHLSSKKA